MSIASNPHTDDLKEGIVSESSLSQPPSTQSLNRSEKDQSLDHALDMARTNYLAKRPKTVAEFEVAKKSMPGGNTRTVLFHGPVPLRIASGDGCSITDIDGHRYVNFLGEYTAGLFGHNHPVIRRAIDGALDRGISLSGHNEDEIRLSQLVCDRFPSIDLVRFTNSGTEANLLAISISRYVTSRKKVLVFKGGYHGGLLYFKDGGMPINAPFDYLVCQYNEVETARSLIRENASQLACVLVEPMLGSGGCIPGSVDFLSALREECTETGALLIFDEVMTSRLSSGGLQQVHGIHPDITTLGKYIGGGMSFGAFGGRKEIMDLFDPTQPHCIPHAGTFNNNTLTMAAGAAAMGEVLTAEALCALNQRGDDLRIKLNALIKAQGVNLQFTGIGSLLALHTVTDRITHVDDVKHGDDRLMELVFLDLLELGYYIARRGFISLMMTVGDREIDGFVSAFAHILSSRRRQLAI